MSTPAPTPATTPIPVHLSAPEFTAFILPYLSMPKRRLTCKLGYHRVFNLIVWVLYTGMRWKGLPIPQEAQGQPAIHSTTVYKVLVLMNCGRNAGYPAPPAQIRTSGFPAYGSYLGCLA
jgi:hypothetical protein